MSTWYSADLTCSACAHRFVARLARGVNAERAPELRERALAGDLNQLACPSCARRLMPSVALVYTDATRGQWISVARVEDLARWSEIEVSALAVLRATLATPIAAAAVPHETMRVVFDVDELRERLMIWDAGLDDGIVECAKLASLRDRPELRGPGERTRLLERSADGDLTFGAVLAMRPRTVRVTWRVQRAAFDEIAGDPAWRDSMPELFVPGFVSIDRYLMTRTSAGVALEGAS